MLWIMGLVGAAFTLLLVTVWINRQEERKFSAWEREGEKWTKN